MLTPGENQFRKLMTVLRSAANLPGYKERFKAAGLEDIGRTFNPRNWAGLKPRFLKLDILNRIDVRKDPSLFFNKPCDLAYGGSTSGTRSTRYIYFANSEWNRVRLDCRSKALAMWGVENTRIINVASRLVYAAHGDVSLVGDVDEDMCIALAEHLNKGPCVLRGYPSRLTQLADIFPKHVSPSWDIKCVICTGENLYDFQVHHLENTFHAPVANEYGCHDGGISGMSCREFRNIHVHTDRAFYETVDGRLVVTDLNNTVMPMIRYVCGDMATLDTQPCGCGRPEPVVRLYGREEDRIRTLRGIRHTGSLPMPPLPGIGFYSLERMEKDEVLACAFLKDTSPQGQTTGLNSLETWIKEHFGPCNLSVYWLNPSLAGDPEDEAAEQTLEAWCTRIATQPWTPELFKGPLPRGTARDAAALLRETLSPRLFTGLGTGSAGITGAMDRLTKDLDGLDAPDQLRAARVMAYAATGFNCFEKKEELESNVHRVRDTLTRAIHRCLEKGPTEQAEHARTDLAIYETLTVPALGLSLPPSQPFQALRPLDLLSIQHLIKALETCWSAGRRNKSNKSNQLYKQLHPLISVLIGDLLFFKPLFGDWLLYSWRNLLGLETTEPKNYALPDNGFAAAWVQLRNALTQENKTAEKELAALKETAQDDKEQFKAKIETAYLSIIRGLPLDTNAWLEALEDLDILSSASGTAAPGMHLVPMAPIIKALRVPLYEAGKRKLSYQCLAGEVLKPTAAGASFRRVTDEINTKQFILWDQELEEEPTGA